MAPRGPRQPLGKLLRSSEAVLEGLRPPKTCKNNLFLKVFVNAGFRYFEALGGPLGPILAPLGPIWSQEGSQNRYPNGSKWPKRGTGSACRSSLRSSCFQDGSKMAPGWLKMAQDGPKETKIASWEPFWVFRRCLRRPWAPKNLQKAKV